MCLALSSVHRARQSYGIAASNRDDSGTHRKPTRTHTPVGRIHNSEVGTKIQTSAHNDCAVEYTIPTVLYELYLYFHLYKKKSSRCFSFVRSLVSSFFLFPHIFIFSDCEDTKACVQRARAADTKRCRWHTIGSRRESTDSNVSCAIATFNDWLTNTDSYRYDWRIQIRKSTRRLSASLAISLPRGACAHHFTRTALPLTARATLSVCLTFAQALYQFG